MYNYFNLKNVQQISKNRVNPNPTSKRQNSTRNETFKSNPNRTKLLVRLPGLKNGRRGDDHWLVYL